MSRFAALKMWYPPENERMVMEPKNHPSLQRKIIQHVNFPGCTWWSHFPTHLQGLEFWFSSAEDLCAVSMHHGGFLSTSMV